MRYIIIVVLILFTINSFSQITPGSSTVGVGHGVTKNDYVAIDSLKFTDGFILLMQDNSTLVVKEHIKGNGIILYGDVGDDVPNSVLFEMQRMDHNGNMYFDYRYPTDKNPKIIFLKCVEPKITMTYGPNIDVEFPTNCPSDDCYSRKYLDSELSDYQTAVYNMLGQKLYEGKFGNIYNTNGQIKSIFTRDTVIIRVQISDCVLVMKRRYITH